MAKFCGKVGFSMTSETAPGIWTEQITEKTYYGDTLRNTRRWDNASNVNDNLVISNQISIIADSFAYQNIGAMRYVSYCGSLWKITTADISYPRITLTLGGLYNGPES